LSKAKALDVAQIALSNLDSIFTQLRQRRADTGRQIESDEAEIAQIDAECAELQKKLDKVATHRDEVKEERDSIGKTLESSKKLFQDVI
jgi:chromosome segregation ATPase